MKKIWHKPELVCLRASSAEGARKQRDDRRLVEGHFPNRSTVFHLSTRSSMHTQIAHWAPNQSSRAASPFFFGPS